MDKWIKRNDLKEGMTIIGARVEGSAFVSRWNHKLLAFDMDSGIICTKNLETGDIRQGYYGEYVEFLIKEQNVAYQKMETLNVSNSSVLNRLVYNRNAQALTVEFKNHTVYMYADVLPCVYDTLCFAERKGLSVGHLFNELVKNVG